MQDVNWSTVKLLKQITHRSALTEEDAIELGRMINTSLHQRYCNEQTKKEEPYD